MAEKRAAYLVTYDLRKDRDYDALYKRLRQGLKAQRVLESVWIVLTPLGIDALFESIKEVLDSDDGLFVVEISTDTRRMRFQHTELDRQEG